MNELRDFIQKQILDDWEVEPYASCGCGEPCEHEAAHQAEIVLAALRQVLLDRPPLIADLGWDVISDIPIGFRSDIRQTLARLRQPWPDGPST